jgi:hypothetical protein
LNNADKTAEAVDIDETAEAMAGQLQFARTVRSGNDHYGNQFGLPEGVTDQSFHLFLTTSKKWWTFLGVNETEEQQEERKTSRKRSISVLDMQSDVSH